MKNFKLQQEAIFHSFLALEYEMLSNFFKFRDIKKKKKKKQSEHYLQALQSVLCRTFNYGTEQKATNI